MPIIYHRTDRRDRTNGGLRLDTARMAAVSRALVCAGAIAVTLLAGCSDASRAPADLVSLDAARHPVFATNYAQFDWFQYEGKDPDDAHAPLAPDEYHNPILAGFYPDPSVCRVGDDYYLVTSTFTYFPGVPIFHSRDLVNWTQIGHVLTRPSQLPLHGRYVSYGIFAPTIRYHDGTFYVVTTLFGGLENFIVTAKDPAGPWSEPLLLPQIKGIDPSLFFDDDGRAYIVNNGLPPGGVEAYPGHRAIWLQEFDLAKQKLTGPRIAIVNGGSSTEKKPFWVEGPHLFKRHGHYYLIAAEGGTGEDHSEVVFRSDSIRGPYVSFSGNPILTQRTLPPDRKNPVTSTGHADFVETPSSEWWSVFLGVRPFDAAGNFTTGRETFLLPVTWKDDWPLIAPANEPIPTVHRRPMIALAAAKQATPRSAPMNGNFTVRDEFDANTLALPWNFLRTPSLAWFTLTQHPGSLIIHAQSLPLATSGNPSFIARRQQHRYFAASAAMRLVSTDPACMAGLAAFHNQDRYLVIGARRRDSDHVTIVVEGRAGAAPPQAIASAEIAAGETPTLFFKIEGKGATYDFSYAVEPEKWIVLAHDIDAVPLSAKESGAFVGTSLGMFATLGSVP